MHVWWKQENDEVEKISWGHHEISQAEKHKTLKQNNKLLHNQQNGSVTKKNTLWWPLYVVTL